MVNIIFLTLLALHIWAAIVSRNNDPLSNKVRYLFFSSINHLKNFILVTIKIFILFFIDVFFSILNKPLKISHVEPFTKTENESCYKNVKESEYPTEILSIAKKFNYH